MFSGRALRRTPRFAMLSARHLCQTHAFCEICCCPWAAPGSAGQPAACADASAGLLAGSAQTPPQPGCACAQIRRETRCFLPRTFAKQCVLRCCLRAAVAKQRVSRCFLLRTFAKHRVLQCLPGLSCLSAGSLDHSPYAFGDQSSCAGSPGLREPLEALREACTLAAHRNVLSHNVSYSAVHQTPRGAKVWAVVALSWKSLLHWACLLMLPAAWFRGLPVCSGCAQATFAKHRILPSMTLCCASRACNGFCEPGLTYAAFCYFCCVRAFLLLHAFLACLAYLLVRALFLRMWSQALGNLACANLLKCCAAAASIRCRGHLAKGMTLTYNGQYFCFSCMLAMFACLKASRESES